MLECSWMVNSDLPITGVALLIVVVAAVIHAEVQAGDISPESNEISENRAFVF